jgi:hypothetical protein
MVTGSSRSFSRSSQRVMAGRFAPSPLPNQSYTRSTLAGP